MSHNVFANNNEISSKASSGKTICNTPDVCFTPPLTPATPPGVPIPYPNTGMASDTSEGSSTVKISNQEVMLKNKSSFSKSSGDEAGSAPKKGVVTSKNMGKVYFNAWSMDVKIEGENVPRNLDITTHNHMSKMPGNTPPMPHVSSMAMAMGAPKCEACAAAARAGNPVNPLRGSKLLDGPDDLDFILEGPLDLVWQRVYMSNLARPGFFGQGWITPVEVHLVFERRHLVFVDREGRSIPFPLMAVGDIYFHGQEMCTLARIAPDTYRLEQTDGLVLTFEVVLPLRDEPPSRARLARMSDENDNAIVLTWDSLGRLQRIDGSGEHGLLFEWAGDRLTGISRIVIAAGTAQPSSTAPTLVAAYEYSDGDLVSVTLRGGRRVREFKWARHIMVQHAQPGGLICSYEWTQHDSEGRVLHSWTNTGSELRFDYREGGTVVTDQDGVSEIYSADRDGHWAGFVDGKGAQYRRVLDANGHLVGTVAPSGTATRTELNERGLPVRSWDEAGALRETEWHPTRGLVVAKTDPLGRTERFAYDQRGNLLTRVRADGAQIEFEYDARGLPVAITDGLGKRSTYAFDQAGRMTQVIDCTGGVERFEYDEHGQLIVRTDALGKQTRCAYSPAGDLIAITAPDGATTRYEYDALGRLIGEIEPMGGRTSFQLRPDGMVSAVVEADGQTTRYARDRVGRLLQIENPNGAVYSLAYDEVGRIVRMKLFEGVEQTYRYSIDGTIEWSSETSRTGETLATTYDHDLVGRLTRAVTSDGEWIEYGYDAAGQLVAGRNQHSFVAVQYDAAGRRVREALRRLDVPRADAARDVVRGFQYAYDENDNIIQTRIPGVMDLAFLRYGSGHLHQIAVGGVPYCDIERDAEHLTRSLTQQKLMSQLRYDEALQLTGITTVPIPVGEPGPGAATPAIDSSFGYDLNGDLTHVQRSAPWGAGRRQFRFDPSRRVVGEQRDAQGVDRVIHWDGAANPVSVPGETVHDNLVRSFESISAHYDGFGRLDERASPSGRIQLTWNSLHQLVGARAQFADGSHHVEHYLYDPFGRRISKTTDGREKTFLWEGERLLMEEDEVGRRVFVYDDRSYRAIGFVLAPNGASDAASSAHRFLYTHNEPPGSPFATTDENGNVLWHTELGAFGPEADSPTPPDGPVVDGSTDPSFQPLRLQGQYFDSTTGLCYSHFRYYDPLVGRFVSPDPIGLLGGENTYRYAPNVFSWIDPLGLDVNQNRIDGARREKAEARAVVKGKPHLRVQRECYLRDCTTGERVRDDQGPLATDEFRRLDIVVINRGTGSVTRTIEVTSMNAPKADQIAKERRIRANGGLCIRDRETGKLKRVPRVSRVVRRR